MAECDICGRELTAARTGRPRRFCGQTCRKRASRANPFPMSMRSREAWVRRSGKRPIQRDGSAASSTDSSTWAAYADVQSGAGDGFGVMLGDGLGCYDLDHVTDEQALDVIATIREPIIYAERSMSGHGVHVFIEAPEEKGVRRTRGAFTIERYTRERFIATTGRTFKFPHSGDPAIRP